MKIHGSFLIALISSHQLMAQPGHLAESLPQYQQVYSIPLEGARQLWLPMAYASASFGELPDLNVLKNSIVGQIDLVYSDHPEGNSFIGLNQERLRQLRKLLPEICNDSAVRWRMVRQTEAKDKESAARLFHGFVIHYRPKQSKEEMKKELGYLKGIFERTVPDRSTDELNFDRTMSTTEKPKEEFADSVSMVYGGWTIIGDRGDSVKRLQQKGVKGRFKKIALSDVLKQGLLDDLTAEKYYKGIDTVSLFDHRDTAFFKGGSSFGTAGSFRTNDSSLIRVMDRNKWKNMLIVMDVTGSMSPYTAQMLIWLRLHTGDGVIKHFVSFNDGDGRRDDEKIIGKTGGIYDTASSSFDAVKTLVYETMMKGGGGDAPENNIEALLRAIDRCPSCSDIVLVADNWAPVKDISLLSKIKRPVHIVLCGVFGGINTDYLNIARATGGSVHLMEDDLTELMKLREGESIELFGRKYVIRAGKFVEERGL